MLFPVLLGFLLGVFAMVNLFVAVFLFSLSHKPGATKLQFLLSLYAAEKVPREAQEVFQTFHFLYMDGLLRFFVHGCFASFLLSPNTRMDGVFRLERAHTELFCKIHCFEAYNRRLDQGGGFKNVGRGRGSVLL
jgi:hypothetical protein